MPQLRIDIDPKGLQRYSTWTHDPGPMQSIVDGRQILEWDEAEESAAVTVGQSRTIRELLMGGCTLQIDEDGKLSLVTE